MQFSLRMLLIAITLVAICGWVISERDRAAKEAEALQSLSQLSTNHRWRFQWSYASDLNEEENEEENEEDREKEADPKYRDGNRRESHQRGIGKWLGPGFLDPVVALSISTETGSFNICEPLDRKAWESIASFRELRRLSIRAEFSQFKVSDFEKLKRLESLSIFSENAPFPLAAINGHSLLKELTLKSRTGCYIAADEPCSFRLKSLRLDGWPRDGNAFELVDFGDLSKLESLWISAGFSVYTEAKKFSLKSNSGLDSLKKMTLINCKVEDFSEIYDSTTLQQIQIRGNLGVYGFCNNLNRNSLPALEELRLKVLGLFGRDEPQEIVEYCHSLEYLPSLKKIDLSDSRIKQIKLLPELPNLRELRLECEKLESFSAPLHQIESLSCKVNSLQQLDFLTDDNNRLKRISIDGGYSRNLPVKNLDCLRFAKNLERVDLVNTGLESLDFAAETEKLKHVHLRFNDRITSIEGLSGSADTLESIVLSINQQLLEFGVLEQPMSQLRELVLRAGRRKISDDHFNNVHLDLKGDLNRFNKLEVPNRTQIGERKKSLDLWSFSKESRQW